MDEKNKDKDIAELKKLMNENESWLGRYGVVTPKTHDDLLLNIYSNFPCVKYVEYYLPKDVDLLEVHIILHLDIPLWLTNSSNISKALGFLPLKLLSNDKLEKFMDILPNADLPLISSKKEYLIGGVDDLVSNVMKDYKVLITLKRWKKGTKEMQ